jgi:PST family polysaccharide transporter
MAETRAIEPQDELDTKILRGSAWATLGDGGTQALSFLTMLVLARLLVPADFGVVRRARAAGSRPDRAGVGPRGRLIVYRGELRPAAACVAVFSPFVAIGLYVVFFVGAPLASRFFDEPELTSVLRVLALVLVFRGFTIMPLALLERSLRFGPITVVELGGGIAQALTAVGLALAGVGLWSLVFGQLAFGLATAVLAWIFSPARPSPFEARRATFVELTRYGRHVGLANLANYANANAQGIIVGRVLGATALGFYSVANRLASIAVQVIGNILGRGVFAAMSTVRDDLERFRRIWLENLQRIALLAVPAALGVALVAEPLVLSLLGDEWRAAIVPLQLLALRGVIGAFSATSGEVFQALHRPKLRVLSETTYLVALVPALVVGARWQGLAGAAGAVLIVNAVFGAILLVAMMRLLGVRAHALGHAIVRPAVGWVLMTVSILLLRPVVADLSQGVQLVVLVAAGAGVYVLSVAAFARDIVVDMWVSLRGARTSG